MAFNGEEENFKNYLWATKPGDDMFDQVIGNGANIFIAIVAVLIGFAAALGYVDFRKNKKEDSKKS